MRKGKGIIFGLCAGILWGLDGVLLSRAGGAEAFLYTILLMACIHDGLASLWILIVNIGNRKIKQYMNCLISRQFIVVFLCAFLGGTAGMLLNVMAIRLAGASSACAVTSAYPVAGAILGIIFLNEKCNVHTAIGIIFVAFGAAVIGVSQTVNSESPYFLWGIIAAFAAMICWASEGVLSKSVMNNISPDVLIGVRDIITCITYIVIISVIMHSGKSFSVHDVLTSGSLRIIGAASLAGAFSYLCWYRSMDIGGAAVGMSLNATYSLWAAVFDILINKNKFSLQIFLGVIVILIGTALTIYSHKTGKDVGDSE